MHFRGRGRKLLEGDRKRSNDRVEGVRVKILEDI